MVLLAASALLVACASAPSGSLREVRESSATPTRTWKLDYPRFAAWPQIDDAVLAFVESSKTDFVAQSEANTRAWLETSTEAERAIPRPPHEMVIEWQAAILGPHFASLELRRYWWIGGAHGDDELLTLNYDLKTSKELSIADVAGSSSVEAAVADKPELTPGRRDAILARIADLARSRLLQDWADRPFDREWLLRGTEPTEANYHNFTFDANRIVIHFAKYQIGPGSDGLVDVAIPRDLHEIPADRKKGDRP